MASIKKKITKDGIIKFQITVSLGRNAQNKQILKYTTFTPNQNWNADKMEKEALKEAIKFEELVTKGNYSENKNFTFAEYSQIFVESKQVAIKTKIEYKKLLKRINLAIGHLKLKDIKPYHLEQFYKNLAEPGMKQTNIPCVATNLLAMMMDKKKLSGMKLAKLSDLGETTCLDAKNGKAISYASALKISKALNTNINKLFYFNEEDSRLSETTIKRHHDLIRNIMRKAYKIQIIPTNIMDFVEAPKEKRKEAIYLTSEQAQKVMQCVLLEADIRIKTALIILIYSGIRKGELCGLEWEDINFTDKTISICRGSLYIDKEYGLITTDLKNTSSHRIIPLPDIVFNTLLEYKQYWNESKLLLGSYWIGKSNRLFVRANGEPIAPDTINSWLNKFIKKNNLPQFHPHTLRHTQITMLLNAGIDVKTIQSISGHALASTLLDTYSHVIQGTKKEATDKLADIFQSNNKNLREKTT